MRSKYIIIIAIFIFTFTIIPVDAASNIDFLYKIENNDRLNSPNYMGLHIENKFNNRILLSAHGFTGNIIGDEENCEQLKINVYKKIPYKSDFDYYLGTGFDYSLDDSDKLNKKLLFFNLKGVNKQKQYSVISEVSYAPLGVYSFNNDNLNNMTAWDMRITYKTFLMERLYLSLTGAMGGEQYQDFSTANNKYLFGLGWDL